jgi:hypothetical protein
MSHILTDREQIVESPGDPFHGNGRRPSGHMHLVPPVEHLGMVGWYDPSQLMRTAVEVFWSTIFGRYADQRLIEALTVSNNGEQFFDYTVYYRTRDGQFERTDQEDLIPEQARLREDIWIDYVSDVGDGWNPTYGIAYHLAKSTLSCKDQKGRTWDTRRGDILILGGDQVYPTACLSAYVQRLTRPYESAFRNMQGVAPHVYALPGNHDWYDNLVSFSRLFVSKSAVAGLPTRQTRSYFALKLPAGWWLLGTDLQLGSEIDGPQLRYFKQVAAQIQPGDRVMLCHAEPLWLASAEETDLPLECAESNVRCLEELFNQQVHVYLAGDVHHYRRHAELGPDGKAKSDGVQKITAGGGGAFLHPTHRRRDNQVTSAHPGGTKTFRSVCAWPSEDVSRRLCWNNLKFPFLNPWFGIVPATLYMLTAWVTRVDLSTYGPSDFSTALQMTITAVLGDPYRGIWILAAFVGILFFTDTRSPRFRYLGGGLHALAHLTAIFFIGWVATWFTISHGLSFLSITQVLAANTLIFIVGWLIGPFILGLYLLISLNGFGRHENEAFSSLRIQDWKHFLRLHLDRDGKLTIYPIGIRVVPKEWEEREQGHGPRFIPKKGYEGSAPELIEKEPVVVKATVTRKQA